MELVGAPLPGAAGRKRVPNRERPAAEDDALNQIAREAEARLAAKRAARAEAREIRMKELEKQQKEENNECYSHKPRRNASASDEDERISVCSHGSLRRSEYSCYLGSGSRASSRTSSARASPVIEERSEKDFEKGVRTASSLSSATLASLGGTFSRRGSGDTSISTDTEASIREIKDISELKDQIQNVEGKYTQGLKEMKDSLAEVEEKYKKAMVSNAQLDNEKTSFMYQVDALQDALLELEEQLAESKRQLEEKSKDFEREKHAHAILQFQFMEIKETLKQREDLLSEIQQLHQKQEGFVREISDLQETIEWKERKIGALERQKDFFDSIRSERDDFREEVILLKEQLKQYGIIPKLEVATNGEISGSLTNDGLSNSSEIVSETSHASKVSEDYTVGRENEVEMENEILEKVGKREILQNSEHEENTKNTKDQEIILKCMEIETMPADENIETKKITEAKVVSTPKLNNQLEDPAKSCSEHMPEMVSSPGKRNAVALMVEGGSFGDITEVKVSDKNLDITHDHNKVSDPHMGINHEIHTNLEMFSQHQNKEKQVDTVTDEVEGHSEIFWEALDFVHNGQMAISTSPELVEVTKASTIDLNAEQPGIGVAGGDLKRGFVKDEQNITITAEAEWQKMETCGISEENETSDMVRWQKNQVEGSKVEQSGTPCTIRATLDDYEEEQEQVKTEEILLPSSKHDAFVGGGEGEGEGEEGQDTEAKKEKTEEIHTEQVAVDDINQSDCQIHDKTSTFRENDSRKDKEMKPEALDDTDMVHEVVDDSHTEDLPSEKHCVDEQDETVKESAVNTHTVKEEEDTEDACTGNDEGKNGNEEGKNSKEVFTIMPDFEGVACLKSQEAEFSEQDKESKSEDVVAEEYHEALDFDESSFRELKASETRENQDKKDIKKDKTYPVSESEAALEESDKIQQQKGYKFEEAKSLRFDSSLSEATQSQETLEHANEKLLNEISSVQAADFPSEQLEDLKRAVDESQEETQMYRKGKDVRLKRLLDEREFLLEQIKKLKAQLEDKQKSKTETLHLEDGVVENGTEMHAIDLQRDANRQISDLKFKLAKSEQEITTLEQNVIRLEGQVLRYKTAAENAERIEDELKAEKRKLQRELRSALDKTEELEVSNGHLIKRLEKMKANRNALLSQQ